MAVAAAPAALPTMPRAERAVARVPPPASVAEGEASAPECARLLPPVPRRQPSAWEPKSLASALMLLLSGKMFGAKVIRPRHELPALFSRSWFCQAALNCIRVTLNGSLACFSAELPHLYNGDNHIL